MYINADAGAKKSNFQSKKKLELHKEKDDYRKYLNLMTIGTMSSLPYKNTCGNIILTDCQPELQQDILVMTSNLSF